MITDSVSNTKLLYLNDTYQSEGNAKVLLVQEVESKGTSIVLDQTIFYPQGGGQPADRGLINSNSGASFAVNDVRMIDGAVHHFGCFTQGTIAQGELVTLIIDIERRRLHARLHSAGHLIDVAMQSLALPLKPTKGYHFPDGPYVEYEGEIAAEERDSVRVRLEQKVNELINSGLATDVITTTKDQLSNLCPVVPDYIAEGKPVRIVTFIPKSGCPCGGTHVKNSQEVGKIALTKIRVKGGQARISYQLD